jgi:hypothetical protein
MRSIKNDWGAAVPQSFSEIFSDVGAAVTEERRPRVIRRAIWHQRAAQGLYKPAKHSRRATLAASAGKEGLFF